MFDGRQEKETPLGEGLMMCNLSAEERLKVFQGGLAVSEKQNEEMQEEVLSIRIEGGTADKHQVDAGALASSMLSLCRAIERTNSALNGSSNKISIKLQGGFASNSLDYNLLIGSTYLTLPYLRNLLGAFIQLVQLKKFLLGEKPAGITTAPNNEKHVMVQNKDGNVFCVYQPIYAYGNNSYVNVDLDRVFEPLVAGANKMTLQANTQEAPDMDGIDNSVELTLPEKQKSFPTAEGVLDEREEERVLEVVAPNLQGEPDGWQFDDIDNDCFYRKVRVEDQEFLDGVSSGRITFQNGTRVKATLRSITRKGPQRAQTKRYVTHAEILGDDI